MLFAQYINLNRLPKNLSTKTRLAEVNIEYLKFIFFPKQNEFVCIVGAVEMSP